MPFSDFSTAHLIVECRNYVSQIAILKEKICAIEDELKSRALNVPHEPLSDGNREGRRARLRDGNEEVTVLFESDILKGSFAFDSELTTELRDLCGPSFAELFRTKTTRERRIPDGHKFRLSVRKELPEPAATQVIELLKDKDKNGITKSKSSVEWNPKN